MSGTRQAFVDRSPGETRAVVLLEGRPERLWIVRDDDATPRLGARYGAKVEAVSARMGLARLDIGGAPAVLRLRRDGAAFHVGQRLHVEVVAEPARGKPAGVRALDAREPAPTPGLVQAPPPIEAQLRSLGFPAPETGDDARQAADDAQAQAQATLHGLDHGLSLAVEITRALTAVDVDLAETGAPVSVTHANLAALGHAARLLRLKAVGGLVAIDLIGFPKAARSLHAAALDAFAPDGPEVAIAPLSRFGVIELAKPHARQPLCELLLDGDARPNARTLAQAVVRGLERQGRFEPGARLQARCPPAVAALAARWVATMGPRFSVRGDLGVAVGCADIVAL